MDKDDHVLGEDLRRWVKPQPVVEQHGLAVLLLQVQGLAHHKFHALCQGGDSDGVMELACRAEWKPRLEQQMAICDYIYDHVYDMIQHGLAKPSAHACNMICTGLKTKRPRMAFDAALA